MILIDFKHSKKDFFKVWGDCDRFFFFLTVIDIKKSSILLHPHALQDDFTGTS